MVFSTIIIRSNNGLGLPIHIKKVPVLLNIMYYILNIRYYIILPIYISLLYIHYIQFSIRIRDFPSNIAPPVPILTNKKKCAGSHSAGTLPVATELGILRKELFCIINNKYIGNIYI